MLALAQMAGADPEAQTAFNGMYHFAPTTRRAPTRI